MATVTRVENALEDEEKSMARMRKKKNLIPRTEACAEHFFDDPTLNRGKWREACGMPETAELYVEIGCGKGLFSENMAKKYPDVCYVAIEREPSCCLLAMEKATRENLKNLFFIRGDATNLLEFFGENEVDRIYINFCDPWTRQNKPKRRLTYRAFLDMYRQVLKMGAQIQFKTDNDALFDFSLEEFAASGWELTCVTRDLHKSEWDADNIRTEFESKYAEQGIPIKRCVAVMGEKPAATEELVATATAAAEVAAGVAEAAAEVAAKEE
ncbi:MAG: tRNA (guanosine(46)-N7)-methyltransferase TrmB [Clostridiales bacterium]|nr:tRNA (guanosine(46)-N7)-methyltransferase TrmB [Clostridiales bacterium]